MAFEVSNADQVAFRNNVTLQLQQAARQNPLNDAVVWGFENGAEKIKLEDIFEAQDADEASDRNGNTIWSDPNNESVWVCKEDEIYKAYLIENADQLKTKISLRGGSTMMTTAALNRGRIRRILEGFYGPIISGKKGTTSTVFPSAAEIAATTGGASGAQKMNTKKLREAGIYLDEAFAEGEMERFMVLTARDNDCLLDEVPATSTDFQKAFGAKVNERGKLTHMLGFTFIHIELDDPRLKTIPDLATNGSGYRRNPFWVKGGLAGNYWQQLRSHVGEVPEKRFNLGTLGGTTLATTRTQAGRCGVVLNAKS